MRFKTFVLSLMATAAVTSAAFSAPPPAAKHTEVLPFIHDDYSRAVSKAKAQAVPIFVEVWAPW